jgi:hypothetical protein
MRTGLVLVCALAVSVSAVAQSNCAAVSGTVRDSRSGGDQQRREFFCAPALLPDDYELTTTTASGFAPVAQSLHLEVGQNISLDIAPQDWCHPRAPRHDWS